MPLHSHMVFNGIFENSDSTSILILDLAGNIRNVNKGFQKSFGYSSDSVVGKNFRILFTEEDIKMRLPGKELEKVLTTGSSRNKNYIVHEDGSNIWVDGESIYTRDENGQGHIVKIIQNIHETKLLEEKLKSINEEQEKTIRDNATFIYTVSHDLKSPVHNIEGLANLLDKSCSDPSSAKALIPMIRDSVKRLKDKINELADIGRERETAKINRVSFQEAFNEVLLDLEKEIRISGAEITADFSREPTVKLSKKNLKSILQNLLSNSVKYRLIGRNLLIDVKTERSGDGYILLNVRDNGSGIEEKDMDRIFRMYNRVHTHIEGTGVGLAIIKEIVENAGGKVGVESKVGEGSMFKIYCRG